MTKWISSLLLFASLNMVTSSALCIVNGDDADVSDDVSKSVVAIQIPGYDNGFVWYARGTAFVIGQDLLMTAAHVVAPARFKTEIEVILSLQPVFGAAGANLPKIKVKAYRVHPGFKSTDDTLFNDIAIIKLEKPLPEYYRPLKLNWDADLKLSAGQMLIPSGFGVTTDYTQPDRLPYRLRFAEVPFLAGSKESIEGSDILYLDQRSTGFCAGDSGGPTFLRIDGALVPVGINSHITRDESKTSTCKIRGAITRISYFRSWIEQAVQELSQP